MGGSLLNNPINTLDVMRGCLPITYIMCFLDLCKLRHLALSAVRVQHTRIMQGLEHFFLDISLTWFFLSNAKHVGFRLQWLGPRNRIS